MGKNQEGKGGSHRVQRVEREIRDVVGTYLLGSFKGDLPGIVSVTRVKASADLKIARVQVTLLLTQNEGETDEVFAVRQAKLRREAVKELNHYAHEAQAMVARTLQMRFTPRLTFFYDEVYDGAMKIERILRDMSANRVVAKPDDSAGEE